MTPGGTCSFLGILACTVVLLALCAVDVPSVAATTSTMQQYEATVQVPAPPLSSFSGFSGGDGWAVAVSKTQIFNVFHHQPILEVACHDQSSGKACWPSPKTITDPAGDQFATSSEPGLYLDQGNGHLFVFAVRTSDSTAGVVCIDTTTPASDPGEDFFCGFTELSAVGDAPIAKNSTGGISAPAQVGDDWYAFNGVKGVGTGTENKLLCFDVATDAACADQPFTLQYSPQPIAFIHAAYPAAAIGSDVIVQVVGTESDQLACFDTATDTGCTGSWPVTVDAAAGAPFPMLTSSGAIAGTCLPIKGNPCFSLSGAQVATPPHMAQLIGATNWVNGPAVVIDARVYVPSRFTNQVDCYDYATSASCPDFPKSFQGLDELYTVNPDPYRPDCLWVNSDHGSGQIQDFDALTGGSCASDGIRVESDTVVKGAQSCLPTRWISVQLLDPSRAGYSSGSLTLETSSGEAISGVPRQTLDSSGSVNLSSLGLASLDPFPQFVIALRGQSVFPALDTVKLTWEAQPTCSAVAPDGYWLGSKDAGVFAFGSAKFHGSMVYTPLNGSMVGMAGTPSGDGYWLAASDGGVFAIAAPFYGSMGATPLNKPVVGMASTPDGKGYWLVASDGGVFSFGDADFFGSMGGTPLNQPVVGMASTPDGKGYWLVASDGGVFSFGDADFFGSMGGTPLNKPVVGMAGTPSGKGYWLVASDGGIFSFGNAEFFGSMGGTPLNKPVVAMAGTPSGQGYWLAASDGGVFCFGNAPFFGSMGGTKLNRPVVGMASHS
jgi:hypothetical protein